MTRLTLAALALLPASAALAHEGLHHHPHGAEYGWIAVLALGAVGGFLVARAWGRK